MSLGDAQRLPVYQRTWFIDRTGKELENIAKAIESEQRKAKSKVK